MGSYIRIGVGSEASAFSSIWKFWVQGDDAYITARTLGRVLKYSLHKSGLWRYAFHSAVDLQEGEDRKRYGWSPREILPGTRVGPVVIVPSTNVPGPLMEPCPSNVTWLREAPPDRKLLIATYIVRNPRKFLVPKAEMRIEAVLPLRSLGALVVASGPIEFGAEERAVVVERVEGMRINLSPGSDPSDVTARVFDMRGTPGGSNGEPVVWDLALTSANFHVEVAAS